MNIWGILALTVFMLTINIIVQQPNFLQRPGLIFAVVIATVIEVFIASVVIMAVGSTV